MIGAIQRVLIYIHSRFGHGPFMSWAVLALGHFGYGPFWSWDISVMDRSGHGPFWSWTVLVMGRFGLEPFLVMGHFDRDVIHWDTSISTSLNRYLKERERERERERDQRGEKWQWHYKTKYRRGDSSTPRGSYFIVRFKTFCIFIWI